MDRRQEIELLRKRYARADAHNYCKLKLLIGQRLNALMLDQLRAELAGRDVPMPELPNDDEPCCRANPALWAHFCKLTGRLNTPSEVWTEAAVVQWIDENTDGIRKP